MIGRGGTTNDDPSADETLVAYLDGQLDADECEAIEARLASDPVMRQRMQALDRVWNALDALPRSTASPSFTRTTIDMAAVAAKAPRGSVRSWRPPGWAIAGLLSMAVGAGVAFAVVGAPERRAMAELPTALNAPALASAGSIEFLRGLLDGPRGVLQPFRDDSTNAATHESTDPPLERWNTLAASSTPQRRAWLAGLAPDGVADAAAQIEAFENRSTASRAALAALDRAIAADPRAADLRAAALAYGAMVGRLPAGEQARLRELSADERLAEVRRRAKGWAAEAALELSESQRAALRAAIDRLVASDAFLEPVAAARAAFPRGGAEPFLGDPQRVLAAVTRGIARGLSGRLPRPDEIGGRIPGEFARRGVRELYGRERERLGEAFAGLAAAWGDWTEELQSSLPERAREQLEAASDDQRAARVWDRLLRQAWVEDLSDAFADLPNDELQQTLLMPSDRFTERLSEETDRPLGLDPGPPGDGGPRGPGGWLGPPPGGGPPDRPGEGPGGRAGGGPPFGRGFFDRFGPPPGGPPPEREPL